MGRPLIIVWLIVVYILSILVIISVCLLLWVAVLGDMAVVGAVDLIGRGWRKLRSAYIVPLCRAALVRAGEVVGSVALRVALVVILLLLAAVLAFRAMAEEVSCTGNYLLDEVARPDASGAYSVPECRVPYPDNWFVRCERWLIGADLEQPALADLNHHCVLLFRRNTVLFADEWGLGILHLGVYNARAARKKDGSLIVPSRWSNHSWGDAIDLMGFIGADGIVVFPQTELLERCRKSIVAAGRRPEIVDEGRWAHIGMWNEDGPA